VASTKAVGDAWLARRTSSTFTRAALQQLFTLLEDERRSLAETPELIVTSEGAELSRATERLARTLAALTRDVRGRDAAAVRQRLSEVPSDSGTGR
jgi:hypothetical protein